jgi:hypothetical protein
MHVLKPKIFVVLSAYGDRFSCDYGASDKYIGFAEAIAFVDPRSP